MAIPSVSMTGTSTDNRYAHAEKFVNASDKTISRMASRQYNRKYSADDKKFSKRAGFAMNSIPVLAVAAGLAAGKGSAASLKQGVEWGLALLAPKAVDAINNKVVKSSPKIKSAEKHHPAAAFLGEAVASVGAFFGASALMNKAADSPKVAKVGGKIISNMQNKLKPAADKVIKSKFVRNKVLDAVAGFELAKSYIPDSVKNAAKSVAESPVMNKIGNVTKRITKSALKNAPVLTVAGVGVALIANSLSQANKYSSIKSDIKTAQFNTAKELVNAYSEENKALREENAVKNEALETAGEMSDD